MGMQGVGKSLLLNSIFKLNGLTLTSANGKACTNVIVRFKGFHGTSNYVKAIYVGEVKIFNTTKMEKMIYDKAQVYYFYYGDDDDSNIKDTHTIPNRGKGKPNHRATCTANEFFIALFRLEEEFLRS
jgi:hypothetical protein